MTYYLLSRKGDDSIFIAKCETDNNIPHEWEGRVIASTSSLADLLPWMSIWPDMEYFFIP